MSHQQAECPKYFGLIFWWLNHVPEPSRVPKYFGLIFWWLNVPAPCFWVNILVVSCPGTKHSVLQGQIWIIETVYVMSFFSNLRD